MSKDNENSANDSEEEYLRKMWTSDKFSGAWTSPRIFQTHLMATTGKKYSLKSIENMLLNVPEYLVTVSKRKNKLEARSYQVSYVGESVEIANLDQFQPSLPFTYCQRSSFCACLVKVSKD